MVSWTITGLTALIFPSFYKVCRPIHQHVVEIRAILTLISLPAFLLFSKLKNLNIEYQAVVFSVLWANVGIILRKFTFSSTNLVDTNIYARSKPHILNIKRYHLPPVAATVSAPIPLVHGMPDAFEP